MKQRPAFEVVFVYSRHQRTLNTSVRGDKRVLDDLQRLFGSTILGVDLEPVASSKVVYKVSDLLRRDFVFAVQPEDGVDYVAVRRLTLRVSGADGRRLTLEAETRQNHAAVYDLLDDVLASDRLSFDQLSVASARIEVAFRPSGGVPRRPVTFVVTHPNSCTLKQRPGDEAVMELLRRWGIDVSGRPEDDTEVAGFDGQHTLRV